MPSEPLAEAAAVKKWQVLSLVFFAACVVPPSICAEQPAAAGKAEVKPFYFTGPHLFPYNRAIFGLMAGDMDGDGEVDLCFVDNRTSKIQMLAHGALRQASGPQAGPDAEQPANELEEDRLLSKSHFLTNQQVNAYTVGDFGGGPGLGVAYFCDTRELFVARRKAQGNWEARQRFLPQLASTFCGGFEAADLNGDGRDDLVFLADTSVLIFLQQPDGTLAEPESYPLAKEKNTGLRLGDIEGDGRPDLVFVASGTRYPLRIRLTQKDGAPGREYRYRMPSPRDVAIGDCDGKGGNELVLIESTTNRIKIMKWTRGKPRPEENLDFRSAQLVPFSRDVSPELRDFAIGDVDGDGLPDIVVTDPGASNMTLIRGTRGGSATPQESFPCLQEASEAAIARLHVGRAPEVFVISKKEQMLGVSRYDPQSQRLSYPDPIELPGKPHNMAVIRPSGRAPGEQAPDRLLCVFEADGEGPDRKPGEKSGKLQVAVLVGEAEGYAISNRQNLPGLDSPPEDVLPLDVNNDGRTDLLAFRRYEPAVLLVRDEQGAFENVSEKNEFRKHLLRGLTPACVAVTPAEGEGRPVIFVCYKNLARALTYRSGNLVVEDQFSSDNPSADYKAICVEDLDGDGKAEILLADANSRMLTIVRRDEKGLLKAIKRVEVGPFTIRGLTTADLGGDGRMEVLVLGREKLGILSQGGSAGKLDELSCIETDLEHSRFAQVVISDLNHDGKNDLLVRDTGRSELQIFYRTAAGEWKSGVRFKVFESRGLRERPGRGSEPREMLAADLTTDGLNDIAIIVHDRVIVYPQQK